MFCEPDIDGPGTITQQPLQPGAIVRTHTHRGIERESAVLPSEHLTGIPRLDQPAASEPAQHPHAHLLGDGGDGLWRQFSGGAKAHGLRNITGILGRLEDPVDDAAMVMDVPVEGGTEAMDEAHRAEAGMRASAAALAQMGLADAQQDVQHGADRPRLALPPDSNRPAQSFGHREDPLAHRQWREDVIDHVRRGLRHPSGVARRAQPAPLTRERNEKIMPTVRAAGAGETVGWFILRLLAMCVGHLVKKARLSGASG